MTSKYWGRYVGPLSEVWGALWVVLERFSNVLHIAACYIAYMAVLWWMHGIKSLAVATVYGSPIGSYRNVQMRLF